MLRPSLAALPTALAAMIVLAGTTLPAGGPEPTIIRTVTIDGIRGPAYYSVVEGRYRAISLPQRKVAGLDE